MDTSQHRRHTRGRAAVLLAAVLVLGACQVPLDTPADETGIELVAEGDNGEWHVAHYRNLAYPCSISGYQSFVVATRLGDDPSVAKPLWVRMRGGGSSYFDESGTPVANDNNLREENFSGLVQRLQAPGLVARVLGDQDEGFRAVSVSMCNRDTYGGSNNLDPNNPYPDEDGEPRRTNGLLATKAAIQFVLAQNETSKFFLHGGSAGSVGTFHVGLALERQGIPADGIVADAAVRNDDWEAARIAQDTCNSPYGGQEWYDGFSPRVHSDLRGPENQAHEMVGSGALTSPLVHVYSIGDRTMCGDTPMTCALPGGSATMLASDCKNEPLRAAIAAQGSESRSLSLRLCVAEAGSPSGSCEKHVATNSNKLNTLEPVPPDFVGVIKSWVDDRLADA